MSRKRIERIDARVKELGQKRKFLIETMQDKCLHKDIIRSQYQTSSWSYTPRVLVCKACGYAEDEDGWGGRLQRAQYKPETPELPRDTAWKYVLHYVRREDKC